MIPADSIVSGTPTEEKWSSLLMDLASNVKSGCLLQLSFSYRYRSVGRGNGYIYCSIVLICMSPLATTVPQKAGWDGTRVSHQATGILKSLVLGDIPR